MNSIGVERRLANVFRPNALVYPIDDVLISGPNLGLANMGARLEEARDCEVDAVLGYMGQLADPRYQEPLHNTGRIVQLSASTSGEHHLDKVVIGSVRQAVQINAEGVSFHYNHRSANEARMLDDLGRVSEACADAGMPLWVHAYARRKLPDGSEYHFDDLPEYADIIAHAVAVVRSLKATVIKAPHPGERFDKVIEAADGLPVVMAGGPLVSIEELLHKSIGAMQAGARGLAVGRNVFNRPPELATSYVNPGDYGRLPTEASGITISNPKEYHQMPDHGVTAMLAIRAVVHQGADNVYDALMSAHQSYIHPILRHYRELATAQSVR